MIIAATEPKLVVMSDLHLGNPFSSTKREIVEFLIRSIDQGYSICINGDGLDIAQTSFVRLTREIPEVLSQLRRARKRGLNVYYCIGNHDILLEHLLDDWGLFTIVPFLNVSSGARRFHVQHGHAYDPFYMSRPATYELVTHLAGYALNIWPRGYLLWMELERKVMTHRAAGSNSIPGESRTFVEAAIEICRRGFDGVIFGHTHHPGIVALPEGALYVNTGSWLLEPHYAEIVDGVLSLRRWASAGGAVQRP